MRNNIIIKVFNLVCEPKPVAIALEEYLADKVAKVVKKEEEETEEV